MNTNNEVERILKRMTEILGCPMSEVLRKGIRFTEAVLDESDKYSSRKK